MTDGTDWHGLEEREFFAGRCPTLSATRPLALCFFPFSFFLFLFLFPFSFSFSFSFSLSYNWYFLILLYRVGRVMPSSAATAERLSLFRRKACCISSFFGLLQGHLVGQGRGGTAFLR